MKSYGIYPGIVIQNNDPSYGGRVKIFVPGITNTVFENWNGTKTDKEFDFTDSADLLAILEPLKDALPWAINASTMFGGGTPVRMVVTKPDNSSTSSPQAMATAAAIAASNKLGGGSTAATAISIGSTVASAYVNPTGTALAALSGSGGGLGGSPGGIVASEPLSRPSDGYVSSPPTDAFGNSSYAPGDYSESEGGMYSIPNVGAHVFVFFIAGDTSCPAFFAINHGSKNWLKATGSSYPGQYENAGGEPYVNKHVLNSNKHTIEFIDDDGAEVLKMSHYSGSNIKFANGSTSELCLGNKSTLVKGDDFETSENAYEDIATEKITTVGKDYAIVVGSSKILIDSNGNISIHNDKANIFLSGSGISLDCAGVTCTGTLEVGAGATGSFTSSDGKMITVNRGIITSIAG